MIQVLLHEKFIPTQGKARENQIFLNLFGNCLYVNILHNSRCLEEKTRKKGRFLLLNVTVFKCSCRSPLRLLLIQLHLDCGWSEILLNYFQMRLVRESQNLRVVLDEMGTFFLKMSFFCCSLVEFIGADVVTSR